MTDNKTATELLKELSALSCDFSEEEIRAHSVISVKQGSYNRMYCLDLNREWLDAWHREFDRITQAIAVTLGSDDARAADYWHRMFDAHMRECATLDSGECEFVIEDNMNETEGMGDVWFRCTSCDTCFDYYVDDWLMKQNYCPHCGKAVKR